MGGKDAEGAPFVVKTYQLVSDSTNDSFVSWSSTGDSFVVHKPIEFAHDVLPKYFKHNNFCSFIRQLNTYGFHKVDGKQWEFKHELFRQAEPQLLKDIKRRLSKKREADTVPPTPETPDSAKIPAIATPTLSVAASPEQKPTIPAFNFNSPTASNASNDEIPDDEVEKLKGINVILMQEVIRLQQQQETTQGTIKQILDELIESRKTQVTLQEKMDNLATQLRLKQELNPIRDEASSLLGLDNLAHLELTPELELNIANLLHITPPASPYNPGYSSPYTPSSPLQPPLFNAPPTEQVHLQHPQSPSHPQNYY
jgi:hypothetical protein